MNNISTNKLILIVVITLISGILIGSGIGYSAGKSNTKTSNTTSTATPTPTQTISPSNSPTTAVTKPPAELQIYTNTELGFKITYPKFFTTTLCDEKKDVNLTILDDYDNSNMFYLTQEEFMRRSTNPTTQKTTCHVFETNLQDVEKEQTATPTPPILDVDFLEVVDFAVEPVRSDAELLAFVKKHIREECNVQENVLLPGYTDAYQVKLECEITSPIPFKEGYYEVLYSTNKKLALAWAKHAQVPRFNIEPSFYPEFLK